MEQKYYVVVELRRYDDTIVGSSSCNCDTDISDSALIDAARVAGSLLSKHSNLVKLERQKIVARLDKLIANLPNAEN